MNYIFKGLIVFLPLTFLLACEQRSEPDKVSSQNVAASNTTSTTTAAPAIGVVTKPAAAETQPEVSKASQFGPGNLSGEALYNSDKAPESMLYDLPQPVIEGVWSAIGAFAPITYANSGHNNNLSFVITGEGVLVVNAGANYLLAKALHDEIKKRTDQPVKYVVLENGQIHASLGTNYWQEQGATVIAHEDAVHEIQENAFANMQQLKRRLKEKAEGTVVSKPDEVFKDEKIIEMGGVRFEIRYLGPTHSPGDIIVWLPQKSLVISGDMAFHQRMLPLFDHTDSAGWLKTWEKFAALNAKYVIPGHGVPTNMEEVTLYTRDYLAHLRGKVGELIENGGSLQDAYNIDQSAYMHLPTSEFLAKRNAGQVFQKMEFE